MVAAFTGMARRSVSPGARIRYRATSHCRGSNQEGTLTCGSPPAQADQQANLKAGSIYRRKGGKMSGREKSGKRKRSGRRKSEKMSGRGESERMQRGGSGRGKRGRMQRIPGGTGFVFAFHEFSDPVSRSMPAE